MTGCTCTKAGYCERHGVTKASHLYHLCRTKQKYFDAWEAGRGPLQVHADPERRTKRIRVRGPGGQLRKMLGCSAKAWPHYAKMDRLGSECKNHIGELAQLLVEYQCISELSVATRLIERAIALAEGRKS